jgi:F-type H+-transporting ATPase subunit a
VRRWLIILAVLVVLCGGSALLTQLLPWALIRPSVVPEPVLVIGGFPVSNSLLITFVVDILLLLLVFGAARNPQLVPGGLQNMLELLVSAIYDLVQQTTADAKLTRWFFPFVMTIFIFVLPANLLGLVPGFGPFGIVHFDRPGQVPPKGVVTFGELPQDSIFHVPPEMRATAKAEEGETAPEAEFVPFFRAPSSDLNTTLALALISVIMTQVYGVMHLGALNYVGKYIVLGKLRQGLGALFKGDIRGALSGVGFGLMDLIIGLIELISEASKIVSFTFRLFGNIFAGEVVLLVMAFLFPLLPLPFYGLELMVGVIQAFVFAVLTLAFMKQATTAPHSAEEHH